MFASVLVLDLHLPMTTSLKDKRSVISPILDGARRRYRVSASEVGHHDRRQRAELGFATVGSTEHQVRGILDSVERFAWSFPEIEVIGARRSWLDDEELT